MKDKKGIRVTPVDQWVVEPISRFINNTTTGGIVLFSSALVAIIVANTPWAEMYHGIWKQHFSISFSTFSIDRDLHHWINDGLMAIFFFVVGLELKREMISGELSNPRNAILPTGAAIGGMVIPAAIYLLLNHDGNRDGWGIPMATDIAFALGILYLVGDRVPNVVKVFLTTLAIADDIGAVLVIAFFYTSDVHLMSLLVGAGFMAILIAANLLGVRSTLFYALVGIGGLWTAFLMSGIHPTIAAVLAAFTIPAQAKVTRSYFSRKLGRLVNRFKKTHYAKASMNTDEQLHILEEIDSTTDDAITPLQSLESRLHPVVMFVILPIFAFSNAGITFSENILELVLAPVTLGVFIGLLLGKTLGVVGTTKLLTKLGFTDLPMGMKSGHVWAIGLLSGIGFTMSIFISNLAFADELHREQAKLGILLASVIASVAGYLIMRRMTRPVPPAEDQDNQQH